MNRTNPSNLLVSYFFPLRRLLLLVLLWPRPLHPALVVYVCVCVFFFPSPKPKPEPEPKPWSKSQQPRPTTIFIDITQSVLSCLVWFGFFSAWSCLRLRRRLVGHLRLGQGQARLLGWPAATPHSPRSTKCTRFVAMGWDGMRYLLCSVFFSLQKNKY